MNDLPDWCDEVPYQIKSIAIKDACKATSNAKLKYKNGGGISKCRFRSRKNPVQSCYIPKSAVNVILLPTFETSQMAKKAKRRIKSKSVRQMLTLSHYKFKQFIKHKAFEYNKVVIDVNEAYTSKTVSWTGEIVKNLGGSKIIKSLSTGKTMNRDLNGARGIFLRALVDTPWLVDNLVRQAGN